VRTARVSSGVRTTGTLAGLPNAFDAGNEVEFSLKHLLKKEE
jgi:hypothetical protein